MSMAWAPSFSCRTGMMMAPTFGRRAPTATGARLSWPTTTITTSTQHLRPTPAPASWALVSTTTSRMRTTPPGCKKPKPGPSRERQPDARELSFEFDVSQTDDDVNYFQRTLGQLRQLLRDEVNPYVEVMDPDTGSMRQIHRLPPPEDTPQLMNLTLRWGEEASVTLSVRTDNLYVVGFRSGHNDGMWFEFDHPNPDGTNRPPMITGSTRLGYSGSYTGSNSIGGLNEQDIFGGQTVRGAIYALANHDGSRNDSVKKYLRILIVNFIESVRFETIARRAADQMRMIPLETSDGPQLRWWEIDLIRSWGHLSEISLTQDMLNAGALVLGMVLTRNRAPSNKRRPKRDADDSGSIEAGVVGLTLAEVVRVVILNINDQHPGYLYGTITVTDGLGAFQLYNHDKDHYEEVDPWVCDRLGLAYAPRPISGADDFVIGVDLSEHYRKVASGLVSWNSRDALSRYYNRILKVPVWADHGSVEVQYVVLTDAVVAKLEVVLVDSGIRVFSPDVFGSVTATTTMASGEPLQYSLFDRARKRYVTVPEKAAIPLQRKPVSAPLGIGLEVSVSLWDANALEPDDHFVDGSAVFTPRQVGTDSKTIMGYRGMVRVQVTWSTTDEW